MKCYRHSNGRVVGRKPDGTFKNFTFEELGIDVNIDYLVCGKCGHGEQEKWTPVSKEGKCPNCDNQDGHYPKHIPLSPKAEELLERIEEVTSGYKINDFIDPMEFSKAKPKLQKLRSELFTELKICEEKSFKKGED